MRLFEEATKRRSDGATKGTKRHCRLPFVASSLRRSVAAPAGFSLIEIMIVVVIIGLLAGIVTYATKEYLDRAKKQRARADISVLAGAVDSFYLDKGRYPDNQEGLKALVPGFIKALPGDPWGRPYQYVQPGRHGTYDIVSYGADGREGGGGADADIASWDVESGSPAKSK